MDNSKITVSVIVTIYNTEKYFDRMIGSIRNQTLKNIEIIIVNDCSPGNVNQIIETYIKEDNRIKYYQTPENSGVGGARNYGMRFATGEYIMFFDGDDWMDLCTLETMYNAAIKEKADIVNCGFYRDYNNGDKKWDCYYDRDYVVDGKTALKMLAHQYDYGIELCVSPTNKIYRHQLIKGIPFIEKSYYEEALFNFIVIQKSNIVSFVKTGKYTYFKRKGSNLQSISMKHIHDYHVVFSEIKKQLVNSGTFIELKATYIAYLECFFYILLEQIYTSSETEENKKQFIINTLNSFDGLVTIEEYIEHLGIEQFRWNLQPIIMHTGKQIL